MDEKSDEVQEEHKAALENEIEVALDLMRYVSRQANQYSDLIGAVTIANISLLFLATITRKAEIRYIVGSAAFDAIIIFAAPIALFAALLLLNRFERIVAMGNAYYQEVIDFLVWYDADRSYRLN